MLLAALLLAGSVAVNNSCVNPETERKNRAVKN